MSSVFWRERGFLAFECKKAFKICTCMRELDTVKYQVPAPQIWISLQPDRLRMAKSSHVLDPEFGKLKLCRRYFGNGLGLANCTHDAVDFAVAQLGEGLLFLQELFGIKGFGHRVGEAKDFLIPSNKVCLGVCSAHGLCGCGIRSKGR